MSRKSSAVSIALPRLLLAVLLVLGMAVASVTADAADLPLATGSPLVGFNFDDRPLLLPVQRNFQMAMLTASSELGRSCGKMEAYGWRMKQSEQSRADQIFNNTVDRLRGIGYVVQAEAPSSVSRDITLFTADRPHKHFIFMWSAGEIGLVMVLCESSPPLVTHEASAARAPAVEILPSENDVVASEINTPVQNRTRGEAAAKFSPVGEWIGGYTCAQGFTGGTLAIKHLNGENFDGEFRFYPTARNPYVPKGSYLVYGQYDRDSQRILINPGKWLERPQGFYDTIMVGSFDPVARSFSAYFQGITGCTSFEARAAGPASELTAAKTAHKKAKKKAKKKTVKKPVASKTTAPAAPAAPAAGAAAPAVTTPNVTMPAVPAAAPSAPIPAPVPPPVPASPPVLPPIAVPQAAPPAAPPLPVPPPPVLPPASAIPAMPTPAVSAAAAASAPPLAITPPPAAPAAPIPAWKAATMPIPPATAPAVTTTSP